jgi:hypothetical protein
MDLRNSNKEALAGGLAAGTGDAIACGVAESTQDTVVASGRNAMACASRNAAMNLSWRLSPHPQPFSPGAKGASCFPPERGGSWGGA